MTDWSFLHLTVLMFIFLVLRTLGTRHSKNKHLPCQAQKILRL